MTHFHAYAYTGRGCTDSDIHAGLAPQGYLPIEIKHTGGPGQRLHSLDEALAWLETELIRYEPIDSAAFPVATRLAYSRARLQQSAGGQVVYGYWSASERYVARRILPCADC
ncbi:hypothetical protein ACFW2V_12315 [Streptomyces sp. NPDC058947]|uniref:hypothetical protein n=1 Tax=Streptomyces sp. NPDC058947 TaxID=3346675 RepID=UPI003699CFD8